MVSDYKLHKLEDLISKIEEVDKMVKLHSANPSKFMLVQYQAKKEKLLGYLIEELADVKLRSPFSFRIIMLALIKFYPELVDGKKEKAILKKDKHYSELKNLEAVLV